MRIFFRKIYFYKEHELPNKGPTIYALNHPTAFIEPLFIASNVKPKTYTMLRGDVFRPGVVSWFLRQLGTIPIYRFRNGFSNMRKNEESFEEVYQKLNNGASISIMSEGTMAHEKRLRTIQKGTAKMALGVYERYGNEEVKIIPIGVSYTDSTKFRSIIMLNVGEPIYIKDYLSIYKENPQKAILRITRNLQAQLKERVVHIDDPQDDILVDQLQLINRNNLVQTIFPLRLDSNALFNQESKIAELVNKMPQSDKEELAQLSNSYFDKIKQLKIKDVGIAQTHHADMGSTLIVLLGFIPSLWGMLSNFLPLKLGKIAAAKIAKKIEFYSSLRIGVYMAVYMLQYLILLIIATFVSNIWFWLLILLTPFLGYAALLYQDKFSFWKAALKAKQKDLSNLQKEREKILKQLFKSKHSPTNNS